MPCPPPNGPLLRTPGREGFADLNRRTVNLQRQVRDNGITYNVYADADGPQRPWSLDLFPLIITSSCWQRIEAGVLQRAAARADLADVYGQQLLARNLLPPALVQGHPGYLRPMHGVEARPRPPAHRAFDLARDPDGAWWVCAAHAGASGLGYLLENRCHLAPVSEAFRDLKVQRLPHLPRAAREPARLCPAARRAAHRAADARPLQRDLLRARLPGALPGPDAGRRQRPDGARPAPVPKTLQGLEPVHGVLKRLGRRVPRPAGTARRLRAGRAGPAAGDPRRQRAGGQRTGLGFLESTPCSASCRRCAAPARARN
jgi:hypothetical protein